MLQLAMLYSNLIRGHKYHIAVQCSAMQLLHLMACSRVGFGGQQRNTEQYNAVRNNVVQDYTYCSIQYNTPHHSTI